jgi:hypothetical protein
MDDQDDFGYFHFDELGNLDMFNSYENNTDKYIITDSSGSEADVTTQELYEFYIFNQHDITDSFEDIIRRLNSGLNVTGNDYEFDWDLGTTVWKGKLTIKAKNLLPSGMTPAPKTSSTKCRHLKKYINSAGASKFWVCPDCKEDLGDA